MDRALWKIYFGFDFLITGIYCAYIAIVLSAVNFIFHSLLTLAYIFENDVATKRIDGKTSREISAQKLIFVVSLASALLSVLCIIIAIKIYRSLTNVNVSYLLLCLLCPLSSDRFTFLVVKASLVCCKVGTGDTSPYGLHHRTNQNSLARKIQLQIRVLGACRRVLLGTYCFSCVLYYCSFRTEKNLRSSRWHA